MSGKCGVTTLVGEQELWRDIPGYEGIYQASSLGRVRSLNRVLSDGRSWRGSIRRLILDRSERYVVLLNKDGRRKNFQVHRLVLMAHAGPCPEGMEACHNDGDCKNNRIENLRWDTHRNNALDSVKHGVFGVGEQHFNTYLCELDVWLIRNCELRVCDLARFFGMPVGTVSDIRLHKTWRHIN